MSTEQTSVTKRAAIHAALGDPARLRIVDALRLGDASPSELGSRLDLPSNLLAHHLKTLETAGVVARHRSEGDRRRTYLRLTMATNDLLDAGPSPLPERVIFVCTANSARSHLAAALWRTACEVPSTSAGTRPARRIAAGALAVAARHDLDLPRLTPRHLDEVATEGDFVVTVCDRAHEELGDLVSLHWSVPDPVPAGTARAFDAAYDDLAGRVDALSTHLQTTS